MKCYTVDLDKETTWDFRKTWQNTLLFIKNNEYGIKQTMYLFDFYENFKNGKMIYKLKLFFIQKTLIIEGGPKYY